MFLVHICLLYSAIDFFIFSDYPFELMVSGILIFAGKFSQQNGIAQLSRLLSSQARLYRTTVLCKILSFWEVKILNMTSFTYPGTKTEMMSPRTGVCALFLFQMLLLYLMPHYMKALYFQSSYKKFSFPKLPRLVSAAPPTFPRGDNSGNRKSYRAGRLLKLLLPLPEYHLHTNILVAVVPAAATRRIFFV